MVDLDHFDLALLDVLQRFGRATHQQLGEEVPLSPSQIGRRLQRLEATGVIDGYRVVLRPEKLGLGVTAFTSLKLKHHGDTRSSTSSSSRLKCCPKCLNAMRRLATPITCCASSRRI